MMHITVSYADTTILTLILMYCHDLVTRYGDWIVNLIYWTLVTMMDHNISADLHTSQVTTAHAKFSPVAAW
jgi:hypothetical protein